MKKKIELPPVTNDAIQNKLWEVLHLAMDKKAGKEMVHSVVSAARQLVDNRVKVSREERELSKHIKDIGPIERLAIGTADEK